MKFLIIGTGFILPAHTEAIRSVGGKIREVVNTTYGDIYWREVLGASDADCVVILTPNDLHCEIAQAASKLGKIVLSEKPLGISSKEVGTLGDNVFMVLQLRYHPEVIKLKKELTQIKSYNEIEMDISVHRDEDYYRGWKGDKKRSGGILFNLGIHYFDLIQYLFGEPNETKTISLSDKRVEGIINGDNYRCHFILSTDEPKETQRRIFKVNGKEIVLSVKDNLSYENLHRFVYKDLISGIGNKPQEALKSIRLIEKLCKRG